MGRGTVEGIDVEVKESKNRENFIVSGGNASVLAEKLQCRNIEVGPMKPNGDVIIHKMSVCRPALSSLLEQLNEAAAQRDGR